MKYVSRKRCKRCKFVGVRTSFQDYERYVPFLDYDGEAFETYPSKMNEPETFEEFKARTYTRLKPKEA